MLVELVQVTTRDGLRLDGSFQIGNGPSALAVDALCFVHGTGGSFYTSGLFDAFAERLLSQGCAVLRVNTRGHDLMSTAVTARGGLRQGAAYEVVDDCRSDLAAWLDWLRQRVGPRIGLLGHSLGAVKCLYALAHEPALVPVCVVAVSPPRLSHSWFCSSLEGAEFQQTCELARVHVEDGQAAALLDVRLPLPFVTTAGGYMEKYGPDERYNYLRFIANVPCPMLVTLGAVELEGNMAFRGAPEAMRTLAVPHGRLQTTVVAGADHFYSGKREELIAGVTDWLREPTA